MSLTSLKHLWVLSPFVSADTNAGSRTSEFFRRTWSIWHGSPPLATSHITIKAFRSSPNLKTTYLTLCSANCTARPREPCHNAGRILECAPMPRCSSWCFVAFRILPRSSYPSCCRRRSRRIGRHAMAHISPLGTAVDDEDQIFTWVRFTVVG